MHDQSHDFPPTLPVETLTELPPFSAEQLASLRALLSSGGVR